MKVLSSLKSAKKRSSTVQLVRRGKRVYAIDKKNPRFKAKQQFLLLLKKKERDGFLGRPFLYSFRNRFELS